MNVSVIIPSLGLDRGQRGPLSEPALQNTVSSADADPITEPERVARGEASSAPGQSGSGLGDGARENLFRSTVQAGQGEAGTPEELTEEEQAQVRELKARDTEVRRHEEAHARVGGQYAGQPSYTFQTGPDGKRYAIGGEVPIDLAPVPDDPQATIAKMDVVIAAALAPAEPSGQDRKVAALASRQRLEAAADLADQRREAQNPEAAESANAANLPGTLQAIDAAGATPEFDLAA